MNCLTAQELLQRHLDGEPILPNAPLTAHLNDCGSCRAQFAAAWQLQAELKSQLLPLPDSNLRRRIVRAVLADRRHRRWRPVAAAAMVAAACVLVSFIYFSVQKPISPGAPLVVHVPDVPAAEPPLGPLVKDGRIALDQLAGKAYARLDQQASVMSDALIPIQVSGLEWSPPALSGQPPLAQSGMNAGLQTVTATTRRGLSFLLRETPPLPD